MIVTGLDPDLLAELRRTGLDHGGNAVVPFVDDGADGGGAGGWPLRCCLTDSRPGDRLAIVAWCPFPWRGAYAETGPVVIHADPCPGVQSAGVPPQFEARRQLVRPYTRDHAIAYDLVSVVEPGEGLAAAIETALGHPDVAMVLVRNVLAGCYSFTAHPT